MISFILSLLGLLAFGFLCLVSGAVIFCVGMKEIYDKEGKSEEYKEIIEFIRAHKK
jgi:hypothetical protein